jgi:hypothetical protein
MELRDHAHQQVEPKATPGLTNEQWIKTSRDTIDRLGREQCERIFSDNPRGVDGAIRDLKAFESLVRETGLARFCDSIRLVRRQVNRMLSGAQPNPVNRMIATVQAAEHNAAQRVMGYVCQQVGGAFVPAPTATDPAERRAVEALSRCAVAAAGQPAGSAHSDDGSNALDAETIANAHRALDRLAERHGLMASSGSRG